MVTYRLEHTFCDNCNKDIKENPYTLKREGGQWDTCSEKCADDLAREEYEERGLGANKDEKT